MNFKFTRFFTLASNIILGAFFLTVGLFTIVLPWSDYLKSGILGFIQDNTLILSLFGWGFLLIGLSVIVGSLINSKRHQAFIKVGKHSVVLDENLIEQYLESYWKEQFPNQQIPFFLTIKKQSLMIDVDLPPMIISEQKVFLIKMNHDFDEIFGTLLGYPHEVSITANFQSESP